MGNFLKNISRKVTTLSVDWGRYRDSIPARAVVSALNDMEGMDMEGIEKPTIMFSGNGTRGSYKRVRNLPHNGRIPLHLPLSGVLAAL
jgi:hypothetical protein